MTRAELSKELKLPSTTAWRYLQKGMPDDPEGAVAWLAANKPDKGRRPDKPPTNYPVLPVGDDNAEARHARLKALETYFAGVLLGMRQRTIPELESKLDRAVDDKERIEVRKTLARVRIDLAATLKQHLSVVKQLTDIEMRAEAASHNMVDMDTLHDALQRIMFKFAQYVRVNIPLEASGNDPFLKKAYGIITGEISAQFQKAVKDLIEELKNPPVETCEDQGRKSRKGV
jgi:hypothetical protein